MESVKDKIIFCNSAIFYDIKNVGITCELNQVRKCITNIFNKTIPDSRIRVSLSIIDNTILKVHDIENIFENSHDLRENILYMLSFEKMIRDEQQIERLVLNDNDG